MKHMNPYKLIIALLTAFLFVGSVNGQGIIERYVTGTDKVQTNLHFIYQGTYTPVSDITYHEFSADSITWRKDYQEGDCYVRFTNTTNNSTNPYSGNPGYHADDSWWVFNFCTCNGAIDSTAGNGIDSMFVYYYEDETNFTVDTVLAQNNTLSLDMTYPDTISGSSTNYQDTAYHTHELYMFIGDNEDVDTTGVEDGSVLKYNNVTGNWEIGSDLLGGGAAGELTVSELDGAPDVSDVIELVVTNDHLTNLGSGRVYLDLTLDPVNGENDYWRTDTVRVPSGDTFIEFGTALPDTDYIIPSLYALLDNGNRQNLQYDSVTVNGFNALDVVDSAYVHYLAIRDVDSLLSTFEDIGRIYSTATDTTLNYLNQVTDDSTITVTNEELTVLAEGLQHDSLLNLNWSSSGHSVDTNIVMNGYSVDSVATIRYDTNYTVTESEQMGESYWDSDEMTFSDVLNENVIGQRYMELLAVVKNGTGETISDGIPVMYSGSVGGSGKLSVVKAIADNSIPSGYMIGITTESISNGEWGYVATYGRVRGFNTTGTPYGETWSADDIIYVDADTAGHLTNVAPEAPNTEIIVGVVSVASNNGALIVNPRWNCRIEDLADVNGTPLSTTGQILVWNNDSSFFDANYNIEDYKLNTTETTREITSVADTLSSTDVIMHVTYTATDTVMIMLPTSETTDGRVATIKDASGNATNNTIRIRTEGSQTIDGLDSMLIDMNYGVINLYSDGTNWFER